MKNILVIEDDHDIRVTIRELLEGEGFKVQSAGNGQAGIEILSQERPSLVLLDLNMPVMNGWEFLKEFRSKQEFAGIPVVILTASGIKSRPDGADAIIPKPIDLDLLLAAAGHFCKS